MPIRRSVYLDRLAEFGSFTFDETTAPNQRGAWAQFFRERIGSAFNGRIVLEIGCNDADLLARVAAAHPEMVFIGLDWKAKAIYDGARRVSGANLNNVALVRGRAQDITTVFADRELDEIWVLHPDPCDRDVELKNRLIAEPFLIDAHRVLRDATSSLSLKTDHAGYYQWVLALFGLPMPQWLSTSAGNAPQRAPKIRAADLMRVEDLPPCSRATCDRFHVTVNSYDYWNDVAAREQTAERAFSSTTTPFENRFIRKRLPIYHIEMQRTT